MYDPTWPKYSSPYTLTNIPMPPPPLPPRKKRSHKAFITAVIVLLLAIGGSVVGIVYAEQHSNTTVPADRIVNTPITTTTKAIQTTPTPAPTVQSTPAYTASTLIHDFCQAGSCPGQESYGGSLWAFSNYTLQTDVNPTSSVQFIDYSRCGQTCAYDELQSVWIGVYASQDNTIQAYNEVNDEWYNAVANGTTGPMNGIANTVNTPPVMMISGDCLLVGADMNTSYGQLASKSCK